MSRAAGPRVPVMAANGAGVWVILVIGWGLAAGAWLAWLAARIAATLTGRRVPSFGEHWIISLARGRTDRTWPGTPTVLVLLIGAALTAAVITAGALTWRVIAARIPRPGDPVAALAANPLIRPLTPIPAADTAIRLRRSLAGADPRALPAGETGLLLGDLQRPAGRGLALFASWEDTLAAFMAPRSGKTTALSIPYVLSAPGAVVATSNKTDLWAATAQLHTGSGGTVWLFDPQCITGAGQAWWWNPLAGLASVEAAHRIASHFVLTIDDSSRRDLWGPAAQDLLCAVFLAAASSGRSLRECGRWLADAGSPVPAELLDAAGFHALAASLRGTQHGAPETRDGIYQTARTAAKCLNDEDIMRWVTPKARTTLPAFDPAAFAASRDALYLLTESRSAAAPLIAALTDTVLRAGRRQAERAGGRLDPPMIVVLDEAANICRIADLPEQYSHLGSRGMVPVTILQSYQQGVAVWGEPGMAALWGASTKKIIGAGIDDPRHARDLATLVGQHDVPVTSVSYGDGRASRQVSLRRQEILEPADIRALPPGSALLLATGVRPALISLRPWYTGPHAPGIAAAIAAAEAAMRRAAQDSSEPPRLPGPGRARATGHPVMTSPPDNDAEPPHRPVYDNVEDWVTSHFLPMFRRPLGGEFRWCAQWWRHAEAITRLTALWHSWEAMRLQPGTGMATWLRDHLDHQLSVLLGRAGPFSMCSEDEHIEPRQARTRPPPAGWWDLGPPPDEPAGGTGESVTTADEEE